MPVTRIPAVVDLLRQVAVDATGLQVIDGPHVGELMDEAIVIGFTDSVDRPGYSTTWERQPGFGAPSLRENFTVRCLLTVASGSIDMAVLRARCGEELAKFDAALRDRHVADGVWDMAGLSGEAEWLPLQAPDGASMTVVFTVEGACLL
ncbi:MAG: hypothetical protein ACYC1Z_03405 [Georgenia sp.]